MRGCSSPVETGSTPADPVPFTRKTFGGITRCCLMWCLARTCTDMWKRRHLPSEVARGISHLFRLAIILGESQRVDTVRDRHLRDCDVELRTDNRKVVHGRCHQSCRAVSSCGAVRVLDRRELVVGQLKLISTGSERFIVPEDTERRGAPQHLNGVAGLSAVDEVAASAVPVWWRRCCRSWHHQE